MAEDQTATTAPPLPSPTPAQKPTAPGTAGDRARVMVEAFLFGGRWLLVPFYALLLGGLGLLLAKAGLEFLHIAASLGRSEKDVLLGVLSLVDSALVASLVVIVVFAGYENFVARVDPEDHPGWPSWMASISYAGLKQKLMSSIIAISAVQLLELFLHLDGGTGKAVSDREIGWAIGLHLTIVTSSLGLALVERIGGEKGS